MEYDLRMVEWNRLIRKRCKKPEWGSLMALHLQMRELEYVLEHIDAGRELL